MLQIMQIDQIKARNHIFAVNYFYFYQLPIMSKNTLRKQTSYSQFRRKNSLSEINTHKSLANIENSFILVFNQKRQELSSIQNELQNIVRNRSLSNNLTPRSMNQQFSKFKVERTTQPLVPKIKRNLFHSQTQVGTQYNSACPLNNQSLSLSFQTIEQSQLGSQQVKGLYVIKEQTNNRTSGKTENKWQKSCMLKKKQHYLNQNPRNKKDNTKIAISQLDEMQKRLECVKNAKKGQLQQKKVKKLQIPIKLALKSDRKMYKTTPQAYCLTQRLKAKGQQILREKQNVPKPFPRNKIIPAQPLKSVSSPYNLTAVNLIPTKMVNAQQKQRLLKDFDRLKQSIKSTQICCDNLQMIRSMMKNIEGLIN